MDESGGDHLGRLSELEEELHALDKTSGRLLVQRRKLHARIRSLIKSLQRTGLELPAEKMATIERELGAATENALNLEVWLAEYRQTCQAFIDEDRELRADYLDVRQESADAAGERERLRVEHGLLEQRCELQEQEIRRLREACTQAEQRSAALDAELRAAQQRSAAATPPSEVAARVAELEEKYRTALMERERDRRSHAAEVASLTRQLSQMRERYETQLKELSKRSERPLKAAPEETSARRREPPLVLDSGAEPPSPPAPRAVVEPLRGREERAPTAVRNEPAPGRSESTPGQLVILDDDEVGQNAAAQLAANGYPVTAFSTRRDVIDELPGRSIACIALNLALPQSWPAARLLRDQQRFPMTPLLGYAVTQGAAGGFWFGPVDFAVLPVSRELLSEVVRRLSPRHKQALVIAPDENVANEVVRQLTRARLNGVIARDRASTLNVIRSVYPYVALVHPLPAPVDVFRAIAALRGVSLFKRIPIGFLLDEKVQAKDDTLLSSGVRSILRLGDLTAATLGDHLASAFSGYVVQSVA